MERNTRECVKRGLAVGLALILLLGGVADRTVFVGAAKGSSEAAVHQYEGGKGKTFSYTGEMEDEKKQLTDDMVSPIGGQIYDGKEKCPVILVTDISENRVLEENTDYTVSYTDNINVSERAAVVITGMGDYTGTVTKTFGIRSREVSADNITLADSEGIYTGNGQIITAITPFKDCEVFYYRERIAEENRIDEIVEAGSYKVRVESADSNYTGAAELDYHVLPKPIFSDSITVTYDRDTVLTYNGQVQRPVVISVKDGERVLSEGRDYEVAYGDGDFLGRGTYTITISGKGNYQGSTDGVFVIQNGSVDTDIVAFELEGMGYQEGYYRSDVTVKVEGYEISEEEEEDESYTESLVCENTLTEDKEIYLKDVDTEEVLGPMVLEKDAFTIIKDAPEVHVVIDALTDAEEWTTEKRIEIPEPEEDVKYYYSSEPCVFSEVNHDRDLEGLTAIENGGFRVDTEVGEKADVYYIYAVDQAGNVAQVTVDVSKIDHTAPTVQAQKNHAHYDVEHDVFWKNAEDLRVLFDISDDSAGVESVSVRPEKGTEVNQEEGFVTFAMPGDYTITVRDQAGNSASVNVAVRQDTESPDITAEMPREDADGGEVCAYDDGDVCWVNRDSVRLPFKITDMEDEDGGRSKVTVEYSTDAGVSWNVMDSTDIGNGYLTLRGLTADALGYTFRISDLAGNQSEMNVSSAGIRVASDLKAPVVTAVEFGQENDRGWINRQDIGNDGTVEISVTAEKEENSSGISSVSYAFCKDIQAGHGDSGDGDFRLAENLVWNKEENICTFQTAEIFGTEECPDGVYGWTIRVTDHVGHCTEYRASCKIDTVMPEKTAYARFISDTAGIDGVVEEEGSWWGKIYSFLSEKWDWIWGKKEVGFELYLKDDTSGIEEVELAFQTDRDRREYSTGNGTLSMIEGLKAFEEGGFETTDVSGAGYTVVSGSITVNADEELEVSDFTLTSVMDKAGNERRDYRLAEGRAMVYLDAAAPEVTAVTMGDISVAAGGPFVYLSARKVQIEIEERFFDRAPAPVFTVYSREGQDSPFEKNEELTYRANQARWRNASGEYRNRAELELPITEGKNVEYQFTVSFQDASGNLLIGGENIPGAEDGTYTSQVFMIAAQKPELAEFSVTGVTDTQIDGAAVYHKGKDGEADVNLEISVMDTPEGWSEENLTENFTLEIFNLSVSDSRPSTVVKGNELNWRVHGNLYSAAYGFSGGSEPANYKASISYKNKLGNVMARAESFQGAGEFDEERGAYTGEKFILDHKPPYYIVSYNAADRLVKAGNTGAEHDKKESQPEAGYTAYYKKNIEVMLTVEEDYAAAFEQGKDSCFGLRILRDGREMEEVPDISWTHQGNIHTGTFRLAEEGSYEVFLRYRDAAGNEMEPKPESPESERGRNSIKDGYQYRSPVLVIDKTAPQIETAYVNESGSVIAPSALVDGRKYFKENVYLQVKVKDKNVRCHEFKDALLNTEGSLSVCDSVGNAVADDSITEFFEGDSFHEDGIVSGEAIWKIPLFRQSDAGYGANYDLTLRCEDLAGNGAAGTGLDNKVNVKVTFDGSVPEQEVLLGFESDVLGANSTKAELMGDSEKGWISNILDFFSGCWLKIFGREKIKFRMYARDIVSGIRTVSVSYKKNGGNALVFDTGNTGNAEAHIRILRKENERKEDALLSGYMLLEGEFTVKEGQDISIQDFTVEEIRDYAGNIRRADDKGRAFVLRSLDESSDLLYLDRKAPVLDIRYPAGGVTEEEYKRIFYKDTVTLPLMLTERFYLKNMRNGSVVTPQISIQGENRSAVQVTSWTSDGIKGYDASAEVCFPAGQDCEQEYSCTVSYQDVAENPLTAGESCKGTAENGVYTEYAVIVDHVAPKLVEFEIDGRTNRTVNGGIPVYHNDAGKDDVTIKFAVDDHDAYWKPEALVFEIYSSQSDGQEPCVRLTGEQLTWNTDGRNHRTAYGFDGVPGMTADRYYVKISYGDRAGNPMVSGSTEIQGKFSAGVYSSREFVLDHTAPVFNISYSGARRVVSSNISSIKDSAFKTPQTGYISYYNDKIDVEFSITEHNAAEENGRLVNQDNADTDFLLRVIKDGKAMAGAEMPAVRWTKTEAGGVAVYKARFTLSVDGRYQISVSYRDTAMNAMTAGRQVQGSNVIPAVGQNGVYTSTQLVLDTHAPVVSFAYVDASTKKKVEPQVVGEKTGRKYFNRPVYFQIKVDDTRSGDPGSGNIRYQELKKALALTAAAADGKALKGYAAKAALDALDARRTVNGEFVIELPMTDEANYDAVLTGFEDLAGNRAAVLNAKMCVDRTKPEAELSCKLSRRSGFADALRYGKDNVWFADSTLLVTAAVKDATAGVREIVFTLKDTDDDGKTLYKTKTYHPPETIKWKKTQSFTVPVPLETADFNGTVTARVTDWSGCTYTVSQVSVIESKKRHKSTSTARITTKTKPGRVVGGVDYYNSDVEFEVSLKDSYSGIRDYRITPGKDPVIEKNFGSGKASGIRRSLQKTVRLSSADNNQNDVDVTAHYTDNANHKASVKEQYNIDVTPPVIQVEYNLNDAAAEKYYKDTRVATVTITERNFDAADVEFTITNTDGTQPAISEWSASGSGDDTQNVCTITYAEDGDYSFAVSFQDKAGNRAEYNQVDEFTIDQTAPAYTVTYDNNDAQNEHYYKRGRIATIDVEEHNFEASNVTVSITKDGVSADALLSGWSSNGDHNIATVSFETDGEYTLSISGADRAENEMEPHSGDHFVVDMTKPEVEIQNVENKSANSGAVAPRIVYNDTNYDASRTEIIYEGYHNGKIDYSKNSTTTTSAQGAVIAMKDIALVQKNDDMYTIKVTVYDKAGNKSDEVKKVFSVNRFGSVYTFDDAQTKMLVGGDSMGYTNTAQDLKIRETNVDTLKFKEITCSHDGMLLPMQEGEEYTVAESGNDVTWKQYIYMFHKDNFEKEGRYTLKIMSGDRAENLSDNDTKGKKIQFVMDTTSPSALISGVEDNGRYQTSSQDVTVDVQDNTLLGRVQMYTNGELVADYTDIKELSELNGRLSQSIEEQDYAQSFKVVATDAAGNSYTAEASNIVITTDWWRLFLANKPLFYGSIVAALGAAALLWITVLARKRKHS